MQFEALVDRKLVDEIVMGKLLEITRQACDTFELRFQVGASKQLVDTVQENEYEQDTQSGKLVLPQSTIHAYEKEGKPIVGILEFEVGEFYPLKMCTLKAVQIQNKVPMLSKDYSEDSSSYETHVEDESSDFTGNDATDYDDVDDDDDDDDDV